MTSLSRTFTTISEQFVYGFTSGVFEAELEEILKPNDLMLAFAYGGGNLVRYLSKAALD